MYEGYNFHQMKQGSFNAATTGKILPCTPASGIQPTIAGFTAAQALPGRRRIRVTNEDASVTVRLGDASLAAGAGGIVLFAKTAYDLEVTAEVAVYVFSDSVTPLVSWCELA